MGTLRDKSEALTEKLLDLARNHPSTWFIVLIYSVLLVALGGLLF